MDEVVVHCDRPGEYLEEEELEGRVGEYELDDEMITEPTGFRFFPTEEELISFYLHNQLQGRRQDMHRVIPVVDIYSIEPFNLSRYSGERCRRDSEQWFFFVKQQEREAMGGRSNRTTSSRSGYWKATGSPSYVYSSGTGSTNSSSSNNSNRVIGVKKTMVFYKGKPPTGTKTKWKMHEYKAIQLTPHHNSSNSTLTPQLRHEFSLCRVYVVSGSFRAFDRRPLEPRD